MAGRTRSALLDGYENSKPVRIGNAAADQLQLDVYGEVMDALHHGRAGGIQFLTAVWEFQKSLLDHLETVWRSPDDGIWEVRGERRHFTHSKVMAWVAFDRAVKSVEMFGLPGPVERWRRISAEIHEEVCRRAFNAKLGAFAQSYESDLLDASALLIPQVGFLPPDDARVQGTVAAIERRLLRGGLVLRYDTAATQDGLPPGEGAFLPSSFWLADAYVMTGRTADAQRLFERLTGCVTTLGCSPKNTMSALSASWATFRKRSPTSRLSTRHTMSVMRPSRASSVPGISGSVPRQSVLRLREPAERSFRAGVSGNTPKLP
jgi:GH15 family glucan-1,4-alpha-glucosidase